MLDTQKLLYILPDLAYLAEFLPGKQPHTFTVQSFKQFNGQLMDDNKLIFENIKKLVERIEDKLEEGELDVIIADEIFTNTIINVEKKTEAEVKEYLQEGVIPSLHIDLESHQIETFILSEYKGTHKVQLSTVQHSALAPLKLAFEDKKVKLNKIYPLSWTLKSLVSLEPSVSLVQMGQNLFMAKHYIGVDQPMVDSIENIDRFVEAIKTMKGAESSMQTAYLLSDEAVEEELKQKLEGIIPIQQLAQNDNKDEALPNFIEKAMTSAIRTVSIDEFIIPEFNLSDVEVSEEMQAALMQVADEEKFTESQLQEQVEPDKLATEDLPKPGQEPDQEKTTQTEEKESEVEAEVESIEEDEAQEKKEEPLDEAELSDPKSEAEMDKAETIQAQEMPTRSYQPAAASLSAASFGDESEEESEEQQPKPLATPSETEEPVDLKKFSSKFKDQVDDDQSKTTATAVPPQRKTLKNDDGTSNLLRVILIGFGSFALTVAIGVGIGFGVLQLSQRQPVEAPVVTDTELEPEPTLEPSPTPMIEINREDYSIRVVNATAKAGYAGEIAAVLEEAGYGEVEARNAVDDYEAGFYLLMEEEDGALLQTISEDLDLELVFSDKTSAEDPRGNFDAIVVLAN